MLERLQKEVGDWLKLELQKSLEDQGHVATGRLKESIDVEVTQAVDLFSIDGRMLTYGKYVDRGRKAGVKKVPIDALYLWVRAKKLDLRGKSALSVAYAIQQSIFKKGIPTDGDEKKLRFLSGKLEEMEGQISDRISAIVNNVIEIEFTNMIERERRLINQNTFAA